MNHLKRILLSKEKSKEVISAAVLLTLLVLSSSFMSLGFWTMVIISSGFVGGIVFWLVVSSKVDWRVLRWPFIITFLLFVVHRVEEKYSGFFERLSEITEVKTPEILSLPVILMVLTSVGSWLAIPYLLKRSSEFGRFLACTFFTSMGVTELAHILVFPILINEPFDYFSGMGSVFILSPMAWIGIRKIYISK